jgi:hypothetical protein
MSYGVDPVENFRLAASYVDRILRGDKPADLPVQAPTKYETAVNVKTAKGLGLSVPRWSAFHMGTPPNNRRCLSKAKDHVFLFETDEVFDLVDRFVMTGGLPKKIAPSKQSPLKIADRVATKKAVLSAIKTHSAGHKIKGKLLAPEFRRGVLQLIMS